MLYKLWYRTYGDVRYVNFCMQDTFARATHSPAGQAWRATIGYLVYNVNL